MSTAPHADAHAAPGTEAIIALHDRAMSPNYGRFPIAMVEGEGSRLRDADGKTYLDLFAGFGAPILGHCHPDLVRALTEQAHRLWHVGNLFHTEPQTRAADAIARHSGGLVSFFSHSGADANEAAIKLARLYGKDRRGGSSGPWGRYKIISTTRSFHGRSFATMGATGNPAVREGFEPLPAGFVNVAYNDLDALQAELDTDTVAVLAEPIQGEGGVNVPDPDYFSGLRSLCDKHDLLLIADEVWTGCGRTGRSFAHQHWGITPDIMTLGKGVGGGLAVGVMAARPELAELFSARRHGKAVHATTLGGNCLAMAVTAELFHVLERDGLIDRARRLGETATQRLRAFAEQSRLVREVRGLGLFLGAEINTDADAWFNRADHPMVAGGPAAPAIVKAALARDPGLCLNAAQGVVIRIAPPITIGEDELHEGIDAIIDTLSRDPA